VPDPAYQYVLTFASASVTLNANTEIPRELAAMARLAWYKYCGSRGRDGLKTGEDGRLFELAGRMSAANETALEVLRVALGTIAKNAEVGTLAYRGGSASIGNVVIAEAPELTRHVPPQPDGTVGCAYRLLIMQIVPD